MDPLSGGQPLRARVSGHVRASVRPVPEGERRARLAAQGTATARQRRGEAGRVPLFEGGCSHGRAPSTSPPR
jgi:hypothetical protein